MNAIILAGGRIADDLQLDPPVQAKAQILLLGRLMVEYVIEAVRGCAQVERICVVAGDWFPALAAAEKAHHFVPEHGDEADNLYAALDALDSDQPTVMLAADVPLITSEMLSQFLDQCPPEADVVYAFIEKRHILERLGDRRGRSGTTKDGWVFARVAEGQFTGGSLFYFRPQALRRAEALLRQVLEARRHLWRLALIVGPGLILRALLQQFLPMRVLSWHDIVRRMGELAKANCVGVASQQAELAFDVDYPTDVELAERELRAQGWQEAAGAA